MKQSKDKFSSQAEIYKKHRPVYPQALYDIVLNATKGRSVAWDCATGNGQVASVLANYFDTVYATDLSENQLKQAPQKENIIYCVCRAEETPFEDKKFDLITVGQAMHWFDFDAFGKEANRVLKDDGVICIWGYGPLKMEGKVGELVDYFYKEVIGSYWDPERKHIDEAYKNVRLNFKNVEVYNELAIEDTWPVERLQGYFDSWSSVQNYIVQNNENPVPEIMEKIKKVWGPEEKQKARLPIFMKIGRK